MAITTRALGTMSLALLALTLPAPAQPAPSYSFYSQTLYSQTLYSQSLETALAPFTQNVEILFYDLRTRTILVDTFAETPILPGSLLKPFLAVAYARTHPAFPAYFCPHHPQPIAFAQALAESCNAYFLALSAQIEPTRLHDLPAPPNYSPRTLIGLTADWSVAPRAVVEAYATLLTSPETPPEILHGMRLAALRGTAWRLGRHPGGLLAKTGTAPCTSGCSANGDGLVLVAGPAVHPIHLLLVRKRGTTGAATAAATLPVLQTLEALHAW